MLKVLREHLGQMPLRLLGVRAAHTGEKVDDGTDNLPVLFFSSKTGEGKEPLWQWISKHI